MSWAKGHNRCNSCCTVESKHRAKGLCASCYSAVSETRQKSHIMRRIGNPFPSPITKEDLEQKYNSGLSPTDIARQYDCTRQYIHKLLRRCSLTVRTQNEARNLALQQGNTVLGGRMVSFLNNTIMFFCYFSDVHRYAFFSCSKP